MYGRLSRTSPNERLVILVEGSSTVPSTLCRCGSPQPDGRGKSPHNDGANPAYSGRSKGAPETANTAATKTGSAVSLDWGEFSVACYLYAKPA